MFSAPTSARRRARLFSAAQPRATTAVGSIVRPRWQSGRRYLREQIAADLTAPGRRGLQLCLAGAWLLDAALQYQPFMFRSGFVTTVVVPAAVGNPSAVTASVSWASRLMLHHVAVWNAAFATIQLTIALGLLVRGTVKAALALSIVWAMSIWWFGESLGGILLGSSPLAGVPGAAILYALIAVLVWPSSPARAGAPTSVATASHAGAAGATVAWLALWGSLVHYLLLPANRAPAAVAALLSQTAAGEPAWLAAIMTGASQAAEHHGVEISIALAIVCAGIALAMLVKPLIMPGLVLATAVGIAFAIAQGLGGVFTGHGTDPSTGPLLILLAACYLPRAMRQPASERLYYAGAATPGAFR